MQPESKPSRHVAELTCAIVSACCANSKMSRSALLALIAAVATALRSTAPSTSAPVAANDNSSGEKLRRGRTARLLSRSALPSRPSRNVRRLPPARPSQGS